MMSRPIFIAYLTEFTIVMLYLLLYIKIVDK
jgi:hypothetical protein